jgi:glycosyltransferase involved in cell wall biosynthesis
MVESRRVLLVSHDLEGWGAQRQLVELAKGLDRERYTVRVASLHRGGALADELAAAGIPVVYFPRRWRWDLLPFLRMARWLRSERIDIVHAFMFLPNFYSRLAGRLAGTPVIVSSLRSSSVRVEGAARFALDVATCFLCHAMVANSQAGADLYRRYGGLRSRLAVIPNGLPPPAVLPAEELARNATAWGLERFSPRIGMVAAFEDRKDQGLLVRALPSLLERHPRLGVVFAGDGATRPDVEALVDELRLGQHVVFLGRTRSALVYPLLDIYVQASRVGEGMSNSIIEAMLHGLPVVATDVGGNRELVDEGSSGRIVAAADATQLANALGQLLDDESLRVRMGAAGRARAQQRFSVAAMVEATTQLYDRLLLRRPMP